MALPLSAASHIDALLCNRHLVCYCSDK